MSGSSCCSLTILIAPPSKLVSAKCQIGRVERSHSLTKSIAPKIKKSIPKHTLAQEDFLSRLNNTSRKTPRERVRLPPKLSFTIPVGNLSAPGLISIRPPSRGSDKVPLFPPFFLGLCRVIAFLFHTRASQSICSRANRTTATASERTPGRQGSNNIT